MSNALSAEHASEAGTFTLESLAIGCATPIVVRTPSGEPALLVIAPKSLAQPAAQMLGLWLEEEEQSGTRPTPFVADERSLDDSDLPFDEWPLEVVEAVRGATRLEEYRDSRDEARTRPRALRRWG